MLDQSVSKYPNHIFIQFEDQRLTYSQFDQQVNSLAHYLQEKFQVQKGEKVCLFAQNGIEFPIAFFAIVKLGGVVIPVNSFFKASELAYILENSETRLLLMTSGLARVANELDAKLKEKVEIIDLKKKQSDYQAYSNKLAPVTLSPDDLVVLIYTSGTTGHPKGAMLSHKNFLSNIEGALQVIDLNDKDRFLVFLPLFHSFTLTVLFLMPLYVGARILLIATIQNSKKILKSFFIDRATLLAGVPQVYELLSQKKLPFFLRWFLNLKYAISGAAPLPEATLRTFEKNWKLPLLEGYGLSEASPIVSINPPKGERKALSVGLPLPNVKVKIVDKKGVSLPVGSEGEICVQGPNVMQGYFKEEKGTREVLKEGWLYTGDVGKVDSEGYLYILDRKKDLILVRGINVYPREIEEVLKQNQKVKEVAVIGINDPKKGEVPVAHLALREGEAATEKELRQWCSKYLANYKLPAQFVFHSELPRTSTGKILKRSLR